MPDPAVPSRRRGVDLAVAILGIVAILWGSYWYLAHQLTELALRRALASVATGGRSALCTPAATDRSPLRLDVGCGTVRFSDPARGVMLDLGRLSLRAPLYWPLRAEAHVAGPLSLAAAAGGATADWSRADLRADAGWGGLERIVFAVRDAKLAGDLLARLDLAAVTAPTIDVTLAPAENGAYRLTAAIDAIKPAGNGNRDLPALDLGLGLTAEKVGGGLGLDPRRTLRAWLARGGEANIDELSVTAGGFDARATGKLTISPEGLISGKIALRLTGLARLPDLAEAYRPGSRDRAEKVRQILKAVTREAKAEEGDVRTTNLTLRDGVVAFGLLPLAVIPPLF